MSEEEQVQKEEPDYEAMSKEDLIGQLRQAKSAQSGVDRAYSKEKQHREELEATIERLRGEKLEGSDELKDRSRDIDYREKLVGLREQALEDAVERGLPASLGVRLAQDNEEETRQVFDEVEQAIDKKSSEKTQADIAKRFEGGHKPQSAPQPQQMSFEQLLQMPEDYLAGLPSDYINQKIEQAAGGSK